ncbi:hypothetical protein F5880DRAFT_717224 [Lentinula raphanica]|nr:hypothetical protein F5880DRAFT_717224 [Lentinula raphanica]
MTADFQSTWWTSANFFRIVVQTWNLQATEGPLFKERGCVFGLPVVAPDTCEVVLLEDPDYSKMLKGLETGSCADLTSEEADELVESRVRDTMQEIRQQSEKIQNNPDRHNLALIRERFDSSRVKIRMDIKKACVSLAQLYEEIKRMKEDKRRAEEIQRLEEETKRLDEKAKKMEEEAKRRAEEIQRLEEETQRRDRRRKLKGWLRSTRGWLKSMRGTRRGRLRNTKG